MGIDTGTTSIHVSKDDKRILEKHDLDQKGVGEAYHTAVEEMDQLREYRELRRRELRKKLSKIKEECDKLGIDIYDLI